MPEPFQVLQSVFGYESFRTGQFKIISDVLAGNDVLAILPTGAGKSLCFQVPAICLGGTAIVISPLISLMQDQVATLQQKGIAAQMLSSVQTEQEKNTILAEFAASKQQLLYLAPERLQSLEFLAAAKTADISLLVVDEAHCISTWGHQFRPEYRQIVQFRTQLTKKIPTVAFTATATPTVIADICTNLQLRQLAIHTGSFRRTNLAIYVYPCESHTARELALVRLVKKHGHQPGIIYAATRAATQEVSDIIQKFIPTVRVATYHGGMTASARSQVQDAFLKNKLQLVVATTAFGMGVDKSNIRFVIHYQLPASLENYYQEIGRAGRDGAESTCFLLCVPHDAHIQIELLKKSGNKSQQQITLQKLKQMAKFTMLNHCFHQAILAYFGETSQCCKNKCGNCLREPKDHELLYGLTDVLERKKLCRLLEWRSETAEKHSLPERTIATDKQLCWLANNYSNQVEAEQLPGIGNLFKKFPPP